MKKLKQHYRRCFTRSHCNYSWVIYPCIHSGNHKLFSTKQEKYFLGYGLFPGFQNAVFDVEALGRNYLCWPDLDVDLSVNNIKHPAHYPLTSKR